MAKDTSITKNLAAATGGAWIGELVTIPFDSLKVLSQINTSSGQRPSTMALARGTIAEHGVLSLWSGLQAGMLRHLLFASLRIGWVSSCRCSAFPTRSSIPCPCPAFPCGPISPML